jgi:uncharacterized protein (TIGR02271 family)
MDEQGAETNGLRNTKEEEREIVVPLHEERVSVSKRVVDQGGLEISRKTVVHDHLVEEMLAREKVEVERVPMGKAIDRMPSTREEGDTIIVPVVEEVLVVERRLVLKEEVRIRRIRTTERHQETVKLRKQEAVITRMPQTNNREDG